MEGRCALPIACNDRLHVLSKQQQRQALAVFTGDIIPGEASGGIDFDIRPLWAGRRYAHRRRLHVIRHNRGPLAITWRYLSSQSRSTRC